MMTLTTGPRPAPTKVSRRPPRWRPRRVTETGVLLAAVALVAGTVAGIVLSQRVPSPLPAAADLPWLADQTDGHAVQVNPSNGRTENRLAVIDPGAPFLLAQASGVLVIAADGRLTLIDLATLAAVGDYQGSTGTVALLDEDNLYAVDLAAGTITRIDPATAATQAIWAADVPLADAILDAHGALWALRADGQLHHLSYGDGRLTDATAPVRIGDAGPAARLVGHSQGVTVIAPDTAPGAGIAVRVGTGADATTAVPGLVGAVAPADHGPLDFVPLSLLDRPTVLLIGPDATSTVGTSGYGCLRPGRPAVHRDLAWIPCLGAGLVIAVDRQGRHVTPDITLADGIDPTLTVHNGHLFASGPDGAGTAIKPGGERVSIAGPGGEPVAAPKPTRNNPPAENANNPDPPVCPPTGCGAVPVPQPPAPTASLSCTSANSQFSCTLTRSPASAQETWYVNGTRQTAWDGATSVNGGCSASTTVSVTIANSSGSVTRSWASCVVPAPPVPTANLSCTSANSQFSCTLSYSPAGAEVTWYLNGTEQTAWAGATSASGGCTTSTTVSVTVGNASGSVNRSWASCVVPPPPVPTASLFCESGGSEFRCTLTRSPASAQETWYVNGTHRTAWDGDTFVQSSCNPPFTVSVTVTNSSGSASDSWSNCNTGPWP